MQETVNRVAAVWVKNGLTLQDLWKYRFHLEAAIIKEEENLTLNKGK